jgi:hypothetical protein
MGIGPGLSGAAREIAQWRQFFRTRSGSPPRPVQGEGSSDSSQWANTEWSETRPESLAPPEPAGNEAEPPADEAHSLR